MKVFLIYTPWLSEEKLGGHERERMKNVNEVISTLGLAYIAAVLIRSGHEVKIFDCQFYN